jgi:sigma-B regulation protein RsbU (phosphoserine phosphatase)
MFSGESRQKLRSQLKWIEETSPISEAVRKCGRLSDPYVADWAGSGPVRSENLRQASEFLADESRMVGEIQRSLLPDRLPEISTLELAVHNRAARVAGGDYFDFIELRDGRSFVFLADVSGHGFPATVLVAALHGIVHTKLRDARSPARFLQELNGYFSAWYTLKDHGFATAFLGLYDPSERSLTYSSAGHMPPRLLSSARHRVELLESGSGYPLGILDTDHFEDNVRHLEQGDRVVLYTDGITEVTSLDGTLFGSQGLDHVLATTPGRPQAVISSVLSILDCFSGGSPLNDDQTIVVAEVL